MRSQITTISQGIINSINSRHDFTYPKNTGRYVVGYKTTFKGNNPSLFYDFIYKDVSKFLDDLKLYDNMTIGGWTDPITGIYFVDIGRGLDNLKEAVNLAKKHNQICIFDSQLNKTINTQK